MPDSIRDGRLIGDRLDEARRGSMNAPTLARQLIEVAH
jgi:hypothetical protein